MTPQEIMDRVRNGQKFIEVMHPPGGLSQSETADWQIIAHSALQLLDAIEKRCPVGPLKLESVMFVLRTMSVVSGAFTVRPGMGAFPVYAGKCPE